MRAQTHTERGPRGDKGDGHGVCKPWRGAAGGSSPAHTGPGTFSLQTWVITHTPPGRGLPGWNGVINAPRGTLGPMRSESSRKVPSPHLRERLVSIFQLQEQADGWEPPAGSCPMAPPGDQVQKSEGDLHTVWAPQEGLRDAPFNFQPMGQVCQWGLRGG